MIYIGIDNGLDGAIVILNDDGSVMQKHVMPVLGTKGKGKREYDLSRMSQLLHGFIDHEPVVFLEKAQAFPKQGISSTFRTGVGYGLWQGILTALGIPFEIVAPREWQKRMFHGVDSKDTKRASALIAGRLAPKEDWRATEKSRTPHDGLTDAFNIAEDGRRRHIKQ